MMIDLNALVIFAKVVESSSFTEAARRLSMPVSTVSRRVAELESQLGVRLLERSTRNLRLTDIGADIVQQARLGADLNDTIQNILSHKISEISGTLRLSAPPNISDTLLVPILRAFQASYPRVRVFVFVTQRMVDPIAEGIDLMFRVGDLPDSSLVASRLLRYRHQLVASPAYLNDAGYPDHPRELPGHRLVAFSLGTAERQWSLTNREQGEAHSLSFAPHLAMNDYDGVAESLVRAGGIGDLPPVVRPDLLRDGKLVEVLPAWRFTSQNLSLIHLGNRQISRPVRLFKDFSIRMAPTLLPNLPD
jgi:DNA-binding transcriptional LysR family regulator